MNPTNFRKMAHGDLEGLRQLAKDFFLDTRRQMIHWASHLETGNYSLLREDLHRCKGGASLFALDRLVAMLGTCEHRSALEESGFDIATFESELTAAEKAVLALKE